MAKKKKKPASKPAKKNKAPVSKKAKGEKAVSQKQLISEFDKALLKEIERKERQKVREVEKRKELNETLRELEVLSKIRLPRVKKDGTLTRPVYPKKRAIGKTLFRRNAISTMLRRHIAEKHLDLIVYRIVDTETGEVVFDDDGNVDSKTARFNLVLKNILSATAELDLKTIEYSFDFVFKEDSGLKPKITRTFDEYFPFFDAVDVFNRPVYVNVKIKISVYIPFTHGVEYYAGFDDPRLPDIDANLDCNFGVFTPQEFQDWFPTSHSYRLCRDWDEVNGSDFGIVEFGLQDREGDEMVHYHLTVYKSFFDRYQVKEEKRNELPLPPAKITTEKTEEVRNRIAALKKSLPFLEGEDRDIVSQKIEDDIIELTMLERQKGLPVKEKPATEAVEVEKEKLTLERLRIESDEREKMRQHELAMAKVRTQEERMALMKEMVAKGFTFDQIKALLGE